jgi:hypothetical protein
MSPSRREFLAVAGSTVALAGCAEETGSDGGGSPDVTTTDSDGDGVPDRHDYAPRDPDVQSENDLAGTGGADTTGDAATDTPAQSITYPSYTGSQTITAADNYWAWEVSIPERFVLEYRITNRLDENYDFDVLLYDPERFSEYRAIATEQREGIRPQYIDGSAPGTRSVAHEAVELPGGTYYLVVDNTDLSDAGDWGTEETRQVDIRIETRAP